MCLIFFGSYLHYLKWAIKYDKWVDEDSIVGFEDSFEKITWSLKGVTLAQFNSVRKGTDSGNSLPNDAAKEVVIYDEEESLKKKRKAALLNNIYEDVEEFGKREKPSQSQLSIVIPIALKKLLVEDWHNISVETRAPIPNLVSTSYSIPYKKLLHLPRSYTVSMIINMFLESKHTAIMSGGNNTDSIALYESYDHQLKELVQYFDKVYV